MKFGFAIGFAAFFCWLRTGPLHSGFGFDLASLIERVDFFIFWLASDRPSYSELWLRSGFDNREGRLFHFFAGFVQALIQ